MRPALPKLWFWLPAWVLKAWAWVQLRLGLGNHATARAVSQDSTLKHHPTRQLTLNWPERQLTSGKVKHTHHLVISFWGTSGSIIICHQPEIRWLGGYSPHKPPFGVRSCEVVIIYPGTSINWAMWHPDCPRLVSPKGSTVSCKKWPLRYRGSPASPAKRPSAGGAFGVKSADSRIPFCLLVSRK